jgi:type II secretory pathway pseudopilin PulG
LAAIAIPALTGYIDKANSRKLTTVGHTFLTAAQTLGTEAYGDYGEDAFETGVVPSIFGLSDGTELNSDWSCLVRSGTEKTYYNNRPYPYWENPAPNPNYYDEFIIPLVEDLTGGTLDFGENNYLNVVIYSPSDGQVVYFEVLNEDYEFVIQYFGPSTNSKAGLLTGSNCIQWEPWE